MKFAARSTAPPPELAHASPELRLDPDDAEVREAQQAPLVRAGVGEDADERDWRARAPAPAEPAGRDRPAATGGSVAPPAPRPAGQPAPGGAAAAGIQRAADLGRTAWAVNPADAVPAEGVAAALKKVKGILNKLTPEKFERLLAQLAPLVVGYEAVEGTIRMVFENAVAQPTFVPMYADLCAELDAALPEYAPPGAGAAPASFKKLLANTCQEEYEAAQAAFTAAADPAEKGAKQRLLGVVRLAAELFRKGMLTDRIVLLILGDLLGPSTGEPPEDRLEAGCELLSSAGEALEGVPRARARLDAAFAHLARLGAAAKAYPPRVRFVVRDTIELRAQHWVARRETFTAKKLDEVRAEAQAELGLVDVALPGLEPLAAAALPGLAPLPGLAARRAEEVELFPAFKRADGGGAAGAGDGGEKFSALLGEFMPLPEEVAAAAAPAAGATPPEAPGQAPRCAIGRAWVLRFRVWEPSLCIPLLAARSLLLPLRLRRRESARLPQLPKPPHVPLPPGAWHGGLQAAHSTLCQQPTGAPREGWRCPSRTACTTPLNTLSISNRHPHSLHPPSSPPSTSQAPKPHPPPPTRHLHPPHRAARTDLSAEDRASLAKSLFSDYLASRSLDEAVAAAQELLVPGFGPALARTGLERAFAALDDAERGALVEVLVALAVRGALQADDLAAGAAELATELDDLALDVPSAPAVLGRALGGAAAAGLLSLAPVAEQAAGVESAEPRRAFVAAALRAVQAAGGDEAMLEAVAEGGVDVGKLFAHEEEFEGHLPPAAAFAEAEGLGALKL